MRANNDSLARVLDVYSDGALCFSRLRDTLHDLHFPLGIVHHNVLDEDDRVAEIIQEAKEFCDLLPALES